MYSRKDLTTLAAIAAVVEQDLDVNRLLFARYLVRGGQLTDHLPEAEEAAVLVPAALRSTRVVRAAEWTPQS